MSAEPIPSAPASISLRTSSRIVSSSAAVGARLSKPMTYVRSVVAPTYDATFCEMPLFSR